MILELDTEARSIKEISQDSDTSISKEQLEADVANIIAITVAGNAMKHYKTEKAMLMYVDMVAMAAKSAIYKNLIKEEEND